MLVGSGGFVATAALQQDSEVLASYANWANILALPLAAAGVAIAIIGKPRTEKTGPDELTALRDKLSASVLKAEALRWRQLLSFNGEDNRYINLNYIRVNGQCRGAGGADQGTIESILPYFCDLRPRRMVIIGAAGSGKTVLCLTLLLRLLESRANSHAIQPVPVRISLATLDTRASFEEWLAVQLSIQSSLSRSEARQLIDARYILPILDGLDEIGDPDDGCRLLQHAVTLINNYHDGSARGELVITCRSDSYERLDEKVLDAGTVCIESLTPSQVGSFIQGSLWSLDEELAWFPVISEIHNTCSNADGPNVFNLLKTPWRVTLALAAYREHPHKLLELAHVDPGGRELVGRYIPAVCQAQTIQNGLSYKPRHAERYLRTLALHLQRQSQCGRSGTDILLKEFWKTPGDLLVRLLHLCISIPTAVMTMLAISIVVAHAPNSTRCLAGVVSTISVLAFGLLKVVFDPESTPVRPEYIQQLRSAVGRRQFGTALLAAFICAEFATTAGQSCSEGVQAGVIGGVVSALAFGGVLGSLARRNGVSLGLSMRPCDPFRPSVLPASIIGLALAILLSSPIIMDGRYSFGVCFAASHWVAFACLNGLPFGSVAWQRHIVALTLLASTRRAPVRPMKFLEWASGIGLMRTVGTAYQFRHDELQKFLLEGVDPIGVE